MLLVPIEETVRDTSESLGGAMASVVNVSLWKFFGIKAKMEVKTNSSPSLYPVLLKVTRTFWILPLRVDGHFCPSLFQNKSLWLACRVVFFLPIYTEMSSGLRSNTLPPVVCAGGEWADQMCLYLQCVLHSSTVSVIILLEVWTQDASSASPHIRLKTKLKKNKQKRKKEKTVWFKLKCISI